MCDDCVMFSSHIHVISLYMSAMMVNAIRIKIDERGDMGIVVPTKSDKRTITNMTYMIFHFRRPSHYFLLESKNYSIPHELSLLRMFFSGCFGLFCFLSHGMCHDWWNWFMRAMRTRCVFDMTQRSDDTPQYYVQRMNDEWIYIYHICTDI